MRKTKHAKLGHEDIGYSYVVIRRGARPAPADTKSGRVGEIGKRERGKIAQQTPMVELTVDGEHSETDAAVGVAAGPSTTAENATDVANVPDADDKLEAALRTEAYHWPRLVFPPLKRSGHIILDGCTAQGVRSVSFSFLMTLISLNRQNHANDNSEISGQTAIL